MQVNATIIAAQQAAREARAALLAPAASFLSELNAEAPAAPAPMRMGSLLDIKI